MYMPTCHVLGWTVNIFSMSDLNSTDDIFITQQVFWHKHFFSHKDFNILSETLNSEIV